MYIYVIFYILFIYIYNIIYYINIYYIVCYIIYHIFNVEICGTDDESFVDILIRIPQSRYTSDNLGILALPLTCCVLYD